MNHLGNLGLNIISEDFSKERCTKRSGEHDANVRRLRSTTGNLFGCPLPASGSWGNLSPEGPMIPGGKVTRGEGRFKSKVASALSRTGFMGLIAKLRTVFHPMEKTSRRKKKKSSSYILEKAESTQISVTSMTFENLD